jgi:hypothetical protein
VHRLVHSHQTISVVLMAKSVAARRSPAMVEAPEGVDGLGAVRRQPDMVSMVES